MEDSYVVGYTSYQESKLNVKEAATFDSTFMLKVFLT